MSLTVKLALGTVGLFRTHRSEEPKEEVRYEKGKRMSNFTCVKLEQIIWLFDELPCALDVMRYLPTPPRVT